MKINQYLHEEENMIYLFQLRKDVMAMLRNHNQNRINKIKVVNHKSVSYTHLGLLQQESMVIHYGSLRYMVI